jgi:hypothetical protein
MYTYIYLINRSNEDYIEKCNTLPPIGNSDHGIVHPTNKQQHHTQKHSSKLAIYQPSRAHIV